MPGLPPGLPEGPGLKRAAGALWTLLLATSGAGGESLVERGAYLAAAGGCITCHTAPGRDAVPMAGGRALESPFGVFHSPNITPDRATGIGEWSEDEFVRAFHEGVSPDGQHYYPAFPYTSYTGVSRDDLLAIRAWLFSLPPVEAPNRPHELAWFIRWRGVLAGWKWLAFEPGRFVPDPERDAEWNRGAYLVRHLGHCGECHTSRDWLGVPRSGLELAGTASGPDGARVPNITPHRESGIGRWSASDLEFFLEIGMTPGGDFTGASMGAVIEDNTSRLTAEDRRAIVTYLRSLPALPTGP